MRDRLVRAFAATAAVLVTTGAVALMTRPARAGPHHLAATTITPTSTSTSTSTSTTTTTIAMSTTTAPPPATTTTTAPLVPPTTVRISPDPNRRWAVGVATFTFVDISRPTGPAGTDPGEASRTLPTIVRYPTAGAATRPEALGAAPLRAGGPFPLIVFAHGYDSSPAVYAALLDAWAGAGYVVAAPAFPRATAGGPLDEKDLDHQPGDVSFVIGRMLASGLFAHVIDPNRIGVAGHSDGGVAALGAGYDTCCVDRRIGADVVMGGDEYNFPGGAYFQTLGPALLVVQADHDVFNPPPYGIKVFTDGHSPKYLLQLINATHLESVTTDLRHLAVVEASTVAFFDRYLKGRTDGLARLQRAAVPALATLTSG
jgi:acetyl esterase/lipase